MSYDFVVGKTSQSNGDPTIIGTIEFSEHATISSLLKKKDSFFLARLCDPYVNSSFTVENCAQARESLCSLLPTGLNESERRMVHKLISVTSYAISHGETLHGVPD